MIIQVRAQASVTNVIDEDSSDEYGFIIEVFDSSHHGTAFQWMQSI